MEIRSVTKAVRLLEALAGDNAPVGVSELGRQLGMDKASVSRMLRTLEQAGFVAQDAASQRFTLGVALIALGQKALKRVDLREAARPSLESLARTTGECAHIAILVANRAFYLDQAMPDRGIGMDAGIGSLAPLHCTALGKSLLAFQDEASRAGILAELDFEVFTRRTITDPAIFANHIAEVRRRGLAHDDEEFSVGVRCIAAPIFRHDGTVSGAIGVSGPSPRVTDDRLAEWEDLVRSEAEAVSRRLGFDPAEAAPASPARSGKGAATAAATR